MLPKVLPDSPAYVKAQSTGRWAEIMCKVMGARTARRWQLLSFRGINQGEWRGVVDVVAIRKSTTQPVDARLKRGDLFDLILIQVKGGGARPPTAQDVARLRIVGEFHHAKAIAQFQWRKGASWGFSTLDNAGEWKQVSPAELFN